MFNYIINHGSKLANQYVLRPITKLANSYVISPLGEEAAHVAERYNIRGSGAIPGQDDALDAFRHAYISAITTRRIYRTLTFSTGRAVEKLGDIVRDQPAAIRSMDEHNNYVGRAIGEISQSDEEAAALVAQALRNGHLQTSPDGEVKPFSGSYSEVTSPIGGIFDDIGDAIGGLFDFGKDSVENPEELEGSTANFLPGEWDGWEREMPRGFDLFGEAVSSVLRARSRRGDEENIVIEAEIMNQAAAGFLDVFSRAMRPPDRAPDFLANPRGFDTDGLIADAFGGLLEYGLQKAFHRKRSSTYETERSMEAGKPFRLSRAAQAEQIAEQIRKDMRNR